MYDAEVAASLQCMEADISWAQGKRKLRGCRSGWKVGCQWMPSISVQLVEPGWLSGLPVVPAQVFPLCSLSDYQ